MRLLNVEMDDDISDKSVTCGQCGADLTRLAAEEEPGTRTPCPECGALRRGFQLNLGTATFRISGRISGRPRHTASERSAALDAAVEQGTFNRTLIWSKTSDAWLAEVRDVDGNLVAVQVSLDPEDLYLLLAEDLLPPGSLG
jgi:hypothetical protein